MDGSGKTLHTIARAAMSAGLAGMVGSCVGHSPAPVPASRDVFDSVAPALAAAEAAMRACREPGIADPTRAMIGAARLHLASAVKGDRLATLHLRTDLHLITANVELCGGLDRAAAEYRAKCRGEARLGMTEAEIRHTGWCEPAAIDTSEIAGHLRERWTYRPETHLAGMEDRPVGSLVFIDGRLTSIHRNDR